MEYGVYSIFISLLCFLLYFEFWKTLNMNALNSFASIQINFIGNVCHIENNQILQVYGAYFTLVIIIHMPSGFTQKREKILFKSQCKSRKTYEFRWFPWKMFNDAKTKTGASECTDDFKICCQFFVIFFIFVPMTASL